MLVAHLGLDDFLSGIAAYLKKHAYGVYTSLPPLHCSKRPERQRNNQRSLGCTRCVIGKRCKDFHGLLPTNLQRLHH